MNNSAQNIEIPNKTTESRRSFLMRLGITIAAVPVLSATQPEIESFSQAMERMCPALIRKFDSYSIERKHKMIESIGAVQLKFESELGAEYIGTVQEVVSDMQTYFLKRMAL